MKVRHAVIGCLIFWLVLMGYVIAYADTVTLNWSDPATCTDGSAIGSAGCPAVTGHKVYCGNVTKTYGAPTTVGTILTYSWTVSTSQMLYCVVTAVNAAGESAYSNEASKTVTIVMPTKAPAGCSFAP